MCLIKWNLPKVDTSIGYDTGHPGLNLATSNHTDESYDEQAVCEKKNVCIDTCEHQLFLCRFGVLWCLRPSNTEPYNI